MSAFLFTVSNKYLESLSDAQLIERIAEWTARQEEIQRTPNYRENRFLCDNLAGVISNRWAARFVLERRAIKIPYSEAPSGKDAHDAYLKRHLPKP